MLRNRPVSAFRCTYRHENRLFKQGFKRIAGIDEVGRGALCGPVIAAAVMFDRRPQITGIKDSKRLTSKERDRLRPLIERTAVTFGLGIVSPEEIDRINIYQATLKAMRMALLQLAPFPDFILVDGTRISGLPVASLNIVKGDARCLSIAAASILAKVARDNLMQSYASMYPMYDWSRNKGYACKSHLEALKRYGPTSIHRRSFRPVHTDHQLRLLEEGGETEPLPVS